MTGFSLGLLVASAVGLLSKMAEKAKTDKLEEYKIFIEDTARYSDRRQTVSNIYVGVNTVIVSAAALILKDACLNDWLPLVLAMALFCIGLAGSVIWLKLVHRYETIIEKRVSELEKIEHGMPGSHRMYREMKKAFCGEVPSFSFLEQVLPIVFIVFHAFALSAALLLIVHLHA